ncbi:serine hydrolase domain-containing protein [Legionella pneumophila]|nr:serine hydrolase domain-containing protein [Legionella pneumophila]
MQERQELMKRLVDNANTPALSLSWCQNDIRDAIAFGKTSSSEPNLVNTDTLFQAASLSKPVSAAIVLNLVAQGKWDLDTPLADIAEYGPPQLKQDPHYKMLTTRMVIGQCSGLANYGQDGDDGTKFIAKPNTRFTYSGVALEFLMQVIEKEQKKKWEEIAQDFFKKVGMASSTFMRQLPGGHLNGTQRDIASAHKSAPNPDTPFVSLPPLPDDVPGIAAGSMLTTAGDYITFLQYCLKDEFLRSNLLTGVLGNLPPTSSPTAEVQWGLGMGVYRDSSEVNNQKTIVFHWGNNTGSIAFCAMDMATGDCVVSFANSMNGPYVFQKVAELVVGDISPLFQWLSKYCSFKDEHPPKTPEDIARTVQSIHSLSRKEPLDKSEEITHRFKLNVQQARANYIAPTNFSTDQESKRTDPLPLKTTLKPPWEQ